MLGQLETSSINVKEAIDDMARGSGGRGRGGKKGGHSSYRRRRLRKGIRKYSDGAGLGGPVNIWTNLRDMSNASWTKVDFTVSVDATVDPAGTNTADKLIEGVSATQHRITKVELANMLDNQPQTIDFYAKKGERVKINVRSIDKAGVVVLSRFDLNTGTIVTDPARHVITMIDQGSGWYYIKVVLDSAGVGAAAACGWYINSAIVDNSFDYQGDGVSGLYLWEPRFYPNYNGAGLTSLYAPIFPPTVSYPTRLPFGPFALWNGTTYKAGPDLTVHPNSKYGATVAIPTKGNILTFISEADAKDIVVLANMVDSRNNWTDNNGDFCWELYVHQLNRWTVAGSTFPNIALITNPATGNPFVPSSSQSSKAGTFENVTQAVYDAIADAFARKRLLAFVVDEPNLAAFAGTISGQRVNDMGGLHKTIWPGTTPTTRTVTTVRLDTRSMWDSANGGMVSPPGGYTHIDYLICQYEGPHISSNWGAIGRGFETPAQYFTREKADGLNVANFPSTVGVIPDINLLNAGLYVDQGSLLACWDYLNNGSSSGYILGTIAIFTGHSAGQGLACGTRDASETRMMPSLQVLQATIDAAVADLDAPCMVCWTDPLSSISNQVAFVPLFQRSDIAGKLATMCDQANARATFLGWRALKT